jgi:sarcosine oxidase subunit beta
MGKSFDVIIIGGGVQGVSTAFHLAKRGVKCLVIEKENLASQATGRSSGMIRMHYDLEAESRLAWESYQFFRNWDTIVGGDCGYVQTGFFQIVRPEFTEQLRANVAMHQRIGIPCSLVSPSVIHQMAPHFYVDDIEIAAYEPESGYADPTACTISLMDAARRKGAHLVQECEVVDINVKSGRISGVITTDGTYHAPFIVNAAGAWAGEVTRMAGVELPFTTWRHDIMYVLDPAEIKSTYPSVIDDPNGMYFRPETGGLTLVGLEDGNPLGESPDGYTDRAQAGFVARAIERICQRIPIMEHASLHSSQGGYDGFSSDQRAILGQIGPEGFYLQCGFSGTGFKIAPAVGACMAELILDGKAKTVDISPFTPKRFEEGKLIQGDNPYQNLWK